MHPAASVILFTVSSGLGYGMLFWLGAYALTHAPQPLIGLATLGVALVLVTVGLLSSTFHLGHPERAWRALSQWRSSWLSREGVAALAVYRPAALMGLGLLWPEALAGAVVPAAVVTAVLAAVTVACTGMIYASLKPIPQWHIRATVPLYLAYAGAGGLLWFAALVRVLGANPPFLVAPVAIAIVLAGAALRIYWTRADAARAGVTTAQAIGLAGDRHVTPLDPPHTEQNYIQREMGFRVARKHAAKLRRLAETIGLWLPLVLTLFTLALSPPAGTAALVLAAFAFAFGALVQRWLFFAQATHVVQLYYGAEAA